LIVTNMAHSPEGDAVHLLPGGQPPEDVTLQGRDFNHASILSSHAGQRQRAR
jgi:hypothetical protein